MTTSSVPREAEQLHGTLKQTGESIADYSSEACKSVCSHTQELLACASESIRKNPIPAVVGALALGITVGCLLMTGRNTSVIDEDTFSDVGDSLSKSLASLREHLKFW